MKNDGLIRAGGLIVFALVLYSCNSKTWTEDEIRDIAQGAAPYEGGNTELTMAHDADIKELQGKVESLQKQIDGIGEAMDHNAKVLNEKTVSDATEKGRCGTRLVQSSPGVWRNEKIACTAKDIWPNG